ncbi:hypothetical protein, partial [Pseudomonas syringae]
MSESFIALGRFEKGQDQTSKTLMFSGSTHEVTGLDGEVEQWNQVLELCDGSRTVEEICALNGDLEEQAIGELLET